MRVRALPILALFFLALPVFAADRDEAIRQRLMTQAQAQSGKLAAGSLTLDGSTYDVLSWSWGASQTITDTTGGGGGTGKVQLQDLHFVTRTSAASSKLFQACAQGKHLKDATLLIVDEKGAAVAELKLTDVLVSSFQTGGTGGEVPMESISLNYAAVTYRYTGL